jgi:two-component system, OmpR family, KDP operon response regulator KdpE
MLTEECSVLVVDDEPPLRRVLRSSLRNSGFAVEEASSAEEALELLGRSSFNLALIDINMPGADGFELCEQLRALGRQIGILVVTVRDSERDAVQALEAGADDYITKPFRLGELVARCHAVLRRVQANSVPTEGVIKAGELEIDLSRRMLRKRRKAVRLTPTEFNLLVFLMKNAGVPLTHARLLSTVWGPEYREEVEYLRAYVHQLRKKIEDDPAQPKYLLTEPWLGYRFYSASDADGLLEESASV